MTKINLKETKIQIDKGIKNTNKHVERQLSEKSAMKSGKRRLTSSKKEIYESGIDSIISDERLINNFSGLGISTGELKKRSPLNGV